MPKNSTLINSVLWGFGRKMIYDVVNDVRREHDIKFSPRSTQLDKAIRKFQLGSSVQSTASKLIQILDWINVEYSKDKSLKNITLLKQYLDFVNEKIGLLGLQVVSDSNRDQVLFDNVNQFYSQTLNKIK